VRKTLWAVPTGLPEVQRQGVGRALIRGGLERLRARDERILSSWDIPPTIRVSDSQRLPRVRSFIRFLQTRSSPTGPSAS